MSEETMNRTGAPNWHDHVFFGIHYDLHANLNDTVLGRDVTPELLRAAWERIRPDWIQCDCKGHPGYTSWPTKVGYPAPGIIRDALRIHREVTREMGLPLVMHYSGIWDEAAIYHHPEWARINARGGVDYGRACPRSGYVDDLLIPQMLEIIDSYEIDGFWVDGDIWATAPCYCPRCCAAFTAQTGQLTPPRDPTQPGWTTWLAFQRRSYEDYARRYIEAVHRRDPGCLVCINWLYSVRHPDPISIPVDFLSGDFSHAWGIERAMAEARVLASRGRPWNLMAWGFTTGEVTRSGWHFKTAAHLCQEVAEVIANGGAVCVYVVPSRSGHLVSWEHDVLAEVAQFCRARQGVSQESQSVPQAVVLHSQEHYYAHTEPLYGLGSANLPMEGALQALLDAGYHVDVQNEDGLLERLHDYQLVVIPEQDPIGARVIDALGPYVTAGGRLVLSGAHIARHPVLAELAGVAAVGGAPREGYHYLPVGGAAVTVAGPWQPVRLISASSLAHLLEGPEPGRDDTGTPAITVRELAKGRVVAIHGPIFAAYQRTHYPRLRRLLCQLFRLVWPEPFSEVDSPAQIHQTTRRQPGRTIIHLLNRGADPPLSPHNVMVERVPAAGPATIRVRIPRPPVSISLVPDGTGSKIEWQWEDGVLTATVDRIGVHAALVLDEKRDQE
jgi:hypothetical protein